MKLSAKKFQQTLLNWYDQYGRKNLPWQQQRSAYRVWISEIMLQQTQVATVIPYFEKFMQRFPDLATLANAAQDDVLAHWAGLGYYSRARNLHKTAKILQQDYAGNFPDKVESLQKLPGIGRSTAGAILAQSMQQRAAILDGNVKRVLTRLHAISGLTSTSTVQKQLWKIAERYTPHERVADYTQAMMDLGATICTRSQPKCMVCPFAKNCLAYRKGSPTSYPEKKLSKKIPTRHTRLLILYNETGEILIQKRPPVGIWGGLWSLPECPIEQDIYNWCQQNYHCSIERYHSLPKFRHTFSHFHLNIEPIAAPISQQMAHIADNPSHNWCSTDIFQQFGFPAPIKQLLEKFFAAYPI